MPATLRISAILFAFLPILCTPVQAEARWKMQFFHDQANSTLELRDIQCPSVKRCIAAGVKVEKDGDQRGVTVVTNDGGEHWSMAEVRDRPLTLFFLNDTLGWMVTDRGVWVTEESGRAWKRMARLKGIVRVHFLDPKHGFAVGYPKAVYETKDGGATWSPVAVALATSTDKNDTSYDCIAFSGLSGIIVGRVDSVKSERFPIWMNPSTARYRTESMSSVPLLETNDGGRNWRATTARLLGNFSRLRINKNLAVALIEYREYYAVPSSVVRLQFGSSGTRVLFAERDRAVTDIELFADGGALIAAVEPPGNSNQVPIPSKLKMLRSNNLKTWFDMDVDYRAVAQRATLAAPDQRHAWVATDTGMILALVDDGNAAR